MTAVVNPTVLVVDDARSVRESLCRVFTRHGLHCLGTHSGRAALECLRNTPIDLMVVDLKMPGMDGLELMRAARMLRPNLEVIVISAHGTIEKAVEAMKAGACDFLTKPFSRALVLRVADKALRRRCVCRLDDRPAELDWEMARIVGKSQPIRDTIEIARRAADAATTILIEGESGTGKELLAEGIHQISSRRKHPLIKVSCAALPEALLEAELFGHEKGAFTGAHIQRKGRFELADGGTLFLDEIGQFSVSTQVKLLRVLQTGDFERLGGSTPLRCNVRIIAATNIDLEEAVRRGRFREDLYYRLNVVRIVVPPLRQRREDIPLLVHHFLAKHQQRERQNVRGVSAQALDALMRYRWPGNVRELENVVERAVVLSENEVISVDDLPAQIHRGVARVDGVTIPIGTPMRTVEKKIIMETLRFTGGDKTAAANLLGIARRTIYRRLAESPPDSSPAGPD